MTGTVPLSGDVSLSGTQAILKREASFTAGFLLSVPSGETATLKDITIDGNDQEAVDTSKSLIVCEGTLNIENGAVLQNNQTASKTLRTQGGAIYSSGGTVNMTGGVIQNNSATKGGGIMLENWSTLNMSGGVIRDNQVINGPEMSNHNDAAAGGGVCLYDGAVFNLSGDARIQRNTSEALGGGISVGTSEVTIKGDNKLLMSGGFIDSNTSQGTGGGVFIQAAFGSLASMASITAGEITNNKMLGGSVTNHAFGGGGIYVNGIRWEGFRNGQLFLENVVVTDNEAVLQGGGYASCPISYTKIYLTNGAAIYGNKADLARDLYIYSDTNPVWGAHAGNPEFEISSTMLGGVAYRWMFPDGTEVPLSQLSGVLTGDGVGFGIYTEATGNANTQDLAKVLISGNSSATRGGGIGSNGDVIIGKADDFIEIPVKKTWQDEEDINKLRPELVEIEVWRKVKDSPDEPVYVGFDRIVPDALTGEWALTIALLPARDEAGNLFEYSLKERTVPEYTSTITGDMASSFMLRNDLLNITTVPVTKSWNDAGNQDGVRPASITVRLLADGLDTGKTLTLTENNSWTGAFTDLDKYKAGKAIVYFIEEVSVGDGYTTALTGDASTGFILTNTRTPETVVVAGSKTWDDANNQDGKRPLSITIRLLKNGTEIDSKTVTAAQDWAWQFTDLPKYEDGKLITYTLTEDAIEYYSSQVQGFDVINAYTPEQTSVQVVKTWDDADNQDGVRPASIAVKLLADGVDTGKILTLTADSNWVGAFTGLNKYKYGKQIVYSIQELPSENGYTATIAGSAATGFILTNTRTPEMVVVAGSKTWDDANNQDGKRPQSITVRLLKNGAEMAAKTITASDGWAWRFEDLPKFEDGKLISYTLLEDTVPDYSAQVHGFDVTNSYNKPPPPPDSPSDPTYAVLHVPLVVNKVLKNSVLKGGEFTFQLKDGKGKVIAEAKNAPDGTVTFPDRTFSREVSNWVYTIHEVAGADPRMIYDNTVYRVLVSTIAVGGQLEAKVKIEKNGTPYAGLMTFVNQRIMPPTGDSMYWMLGLLAASSLLLIASACLISVRRKRDS